MAEDQLSWDRFNSVTVTLVDGWTLEEYLVRQEGMKIYYWVDGISHVVDTGYRNADGKMVYDLVVVDKASQ